jgi:hypothetical protein
MKVAKHGDIVRRFEDVNLKNLMHTESEDSGLLCCYAARIGVIDL